MKQTYLSDDVVLLLENTHMLGKLRVLDDLINESKRIEKRIKDHASTCSREATSCGDTCAYYQWYKGATEAFYDKLAVATSDILELIE